LCWIPHKLVVTVCSVGRWGWCPALHPPSRSRVSAGNRPDIGTAVEPAGAIGTVDLESILPDRDTGVQRPGIEAVDMGRPGEHGGTGSCGGDYGGDTSGDAGTAASSDGEDCDADRGGGYAAD